MIANPLGWVQVQLLGGRRRTLMLTGAYAALVLAVHLLLYRPLKAQGVGATAFASGALNVMTFASGLVIFLMGTNAIRRAIQRDFTTDMITSHRLTAVSGYTAIIGYLTGATAQVLALTVVNWAACTVLAAIGGAPAHGPTMLLIGISCLAWMFWVLGILLGLCSRGRYSALGVLVFAGVAASSQVSGMVPGFSLLIGATTINSLRAGAGTGQMDASIFVAMLAQLTCGLTFFVAAARKFTRDDVPAFSPVLACALLAICALLGAVALRFWPGTSVIPAMILSDLRPQILATLAVLGLVALLPVAAMADRSVRWAKRRAKDPDFRARPPMPYWIAPLLAAVVVFGILGVVLGPIRQELFPAGPQPPATPRPPLPSVAWAAAFFVVFLMTCAGLLRLAYAKRWKVIWVLAVCLAVTWIAPPALDLALELARGLPWGLSRTMLVACSPVGAWVITFGMVDGPLLPGLVVQLVLAAGALFFAHRARA